MQRNPGYRIGHELVCVCDVEEENMKPMTLRLFRQGDMRRSSSPDRSAGPAWLDTVLARNAPAAYLRTFGSPTNLQSFREEVPTTTHDALAPWLERVAGGEPMCSSGPALRL
ncbi:MAG: GH3 auxin-responsive promoter family protein [Candidatus Moduliflexus flocculans]|nr:GH3 auxin-responsive promoter family protein [Candidatus Moduliflexus flocculans]